MTPASSLDLSPVFHDVNLAAFAADVGVHLSQRPRRLPSQYLYDDLGSALFDAICHLPWYQVSRAERALLAAHGRAILGISGPLARVIELGPGSGEKLATLVRSCPATFSRLAVDLVDVSGAALSAASRTLGSAGVTHVETHQASYEAGLDRALEERSGQGRGLVLLLGSNIGNFDPVHADDFLRRMRARLNPGDGLLLGADLRKPERTLLLAYDDPLGVTAAFNRNLLVRLNRELDATFDLTAFRHAAVWNADRSRVEMHLECTRPHQVSIPRAQVDFALRIDERIWTESSYKYDAADIVRQLERCGFGVSAQWIDHTAQFAITLASI